MIHFPFQMFEFESGPVTTREADNHRGDRSQATYRHKLSRQQRLPHEAIDHALPPGCTVVQGN